MKKIIKMSKPKQTSPYGNEKGDDELIEFTKEEKMKCKLCGAEIITPTKTIKIKELKIEVETQIHDKGNKLSDIKIPKGWRLLKAQEVITLHNKYAKELNMLVTWEFIEQPFELNKQKSYVARFVAVSDGAYLYCGRGPEFSGSSLGVRFCKDITEEKKKTLKEWSDEMLQSGKLFDLDISRIKELFDLFKEKGYNLREDGDWIAIKRDFFG